MQLNKRRSFFQKLFKFLSPEVLIHPSFHSDTSRWFPRYRHLMTGFKGLLQATNFRSRPLSNYKRTAIEPILVSYIVSTILSKFFVRSISNWCHYSSLKSLVVASVSPSCFAVHFVGVRPVGGTCIFDRKQCQWASRNEFGVSEIEEKRSKQWL